VVTRLTTTLVGAMALLQGSTAYAADASVVQVRVDRALACSGTLVAPRFILTSSHCLRRKNRPVATRRLAIVAGSGPLRVSKVAAVVRAPVIGNRRPDVALLQMTSSSGLKPAAISTRSRLRGGTALTTRGWTSSKRSRTVGGRVTARGCGRRARGAGFICARWNRASRALRCADLSGFRLTTRPSGKVVGIGAGGGPRCGTARRAAFVNVARTAVRSWIETQTAPPPTTPTPGDPNPLPGNPSPSYLGAWSGSISQDNLQSGKEYLAKVTIDRTGTVGEVIGSSAYSDPTAAAPGCGGTLQLLGGNRSGLALLERITYGQSACVDGGTIQLAKVAGRDALTYSWTKGSGDGRASGVLQREG
jgi:hypothetical protein